MERDYFIISFLAPEERNVESLHSSRAKIITEPSYKHAAPTEPVRLLTAHCSLLTASRTHRRELRSHDQSRCAITLVSHIDLKCMHARCN